MTFWQEPTKEPAHDQYAPRQRTRHPMPFSSASWSLMAVLEVAAPRRRRELPGCCGGSNNLGIVVVQHDPSAIDVTCRRCRLAITAQERGWGLLNNFAVPGGCHHPFHIGARPSDLPAACDVSCGARPVAAPQNASCGPGIRRHHRVTLPSRGNPAFHGHQAGRGLPR